MQKNQPNKPEKPADASRFEIFSVLEDKTGFKILGSHHVFYFDKYGGWYDEYDNYYNAEGVPGAAPDYSSEDDENKHAIEDYPDGRDIEITAWNLPFAATEAEFEKFLTEKKIAWVIFEFEFDKQDKFNGTVYLTLTKDNAKKFVELNGTKFGGRELKIRVEEPEDEAERLAKDYEDVDDEGEDQLKHYESVYLNTENKATLESYPKDKEIQVRAWNISYNTSEDVFEKLLTDNKIDWILFEFEFNNQDKFNGTVHLTFDKANAEKFIELNGTSWNGRDIKIQVEKPVEEVHGAEEHNADDEEDDDDEEEEEEGAEGKGPEEAKSAETQ